VAVTADVAVDRRNATGHTANSATDLVSSIGIRGSP
jgi:hypothetical protein